MILYYIDKMEKKDSYQKLKLSWLVVLTRSYLLLLENAITDYELRKFDTCK